MELQKTLHEIFLKAPINRFDSFIVACQAWYKRPAHTLQELRPMGISNAHLSPTAEHF